MSSTSYDATLKVLVDADPNDWPPRCPPGPTTVIDAEIATVSGAAYKVLLVNADPPYLLHLEFASGHDGAALPPLLHMRNAVLECRQNLPVLSAVVLLRPSISTAC